MIRKVKEKDYVQLIKLVNQAHQLHLDNRPDIFKDGNPLPKEYFDEIISDKNALNYVYEENNKICGLLMSIRKENNTIPIAKQRTSYFIEDIVVDISCRRKGIGKELYNFLVQQAKIENVDAIELNVWAFNEDAIKFYESLGMSVKNLKMEKILSSNSIDTKENTMLITNKVK